MLAKIYWNLLVLFGVLCHGIIDTLAEKDIDESSEVLVRQKRVINRTPGGDKIEKIKNVPYIVSLKQVGNSSFCSGVILKHSVVLTSAECVLHNNTRAYRVFSGNVRFLRVGTHTVMHNVTEKRICLGNFPYRPNDGIALLTVFPTFVYSINTRSIDLYQGQDIQPGSYGTVSGWGCNPTGHPGTANPESLRSIEVRIISNQECAAFYNNSRFPISANDICTFDPSGYQYCGLNDGGAPLIIKDYYMPYLVGINLHNVGSAGGTKPDVFANLQAHRYKTCIRENIDSM